MGRIYGTISQKGVAGSITQKGVRGSIVESGAFNWSAWWATRTPSGLETTAISDTSIQVDWTDGAEAADGIHVYVDGVLTEIAAYGDETVTLTGLTAGTEYTITVVAYSGSQESPAITGTQYTFNIAGFIAYLTTEGIWAKLDLVNLAMAGTSGYKNLKDDAVVASLSDAGKAFLENNVGFFTNAFDGYIVYDWKPSEVGNNYSVNSAYFGVYNWMPIFENTPIAGCYDGTNQLTLQILRNNNQLRYAINMGASTKNIAYTGASDGLISLRKLNNDVTVSRNGVEINTSAITTTNVPTVKLWGCCNNNNGALISPSYRKLGAVITGAYLTNAEDLKIKYALDTYILSAINYPDYYDSGSVRYSIVGHDIKNIKCVDGDYMFAVTSGYVWYSSNAGSTWTSKAFTDALYVDFVKFWDTGTVSFAAYNKIYRSDDALTTIVEVITQLPDTSPYTIHVPVNATYPGTYYWLIDATKKMYRSGAEIFIWGNYANVNRGAAPVNVYELSNDGQVCTVIYQFGQNPFYKDDGTTDGGTTGNLLGDATNPEYVRHIHSVCWDETNATVYFCTGDFDRAGPIYEVKWVKLVYSLGVYTPTILVEATYASCYKATGLNVINGYVYYAADIDAPLATRGVYKVAIADIADINKHTLLYYTPNTFMSLVRDGNNLIATTFSGTQFVLISKDLGVTWEEVLLEKMPGYSSNGRMQCIGNKDSDGYFWYYHNYNDWSYNMKIKVKII